MPTNVDDKIDKLSPDQRKKVEARAAHLIADELTLRELRHARKLTQVRMAKTLGIRCHFTGIIRDSFGNCAIMAVVPGLVARGRDRARSGVGDWM